MMQADRSHLPLKLNTAGVIPPIFASSLLLLPLTITQFAGNSVATDSTTYSVLQTLNQYLAHGQPLYLALYAAGIIFFCFFYTAVVFNPEETVREPEEERRVHPRHPSGQAHRRISRLRAHAHHRDRRGLPDAWSACCPNT